MVRIAEEADGLKFVGEPVEQIGLAGKVVRVYHLLTVGFTTKRPQDSDLRVANQATLESFLDERGVTPLIG